MWPKGYAWLTEPDLKKLLLRCGGVLRVRRLLEETLFLFGSLSPNYDAFGRLGKL
jgi:hypothetical protein